MPRIHSLNPDFQDLRISRIFGNMLAEIRQPAFLAVSMLAETRQEAFPAVNTLAELRQQVFPAVDMLAETRQLAFPAVNTLAETRQQAFPGEIIKNMRFSTQNKGGSYENRQN